MKRFLASLERVLAEPEFLDRFYVSFMAVSPEIARIFRNTDMAGLQHKLRGTLRVVALAVEGEPGAEDYLRFLGRTHARLDVRAPHYQMWRSALIDTVAEMDPAFDAGVRRAWVRVLDCAIAILREGTPVTAAR